MTSMRSSTRGVRARMLRTATVSGVGVAVVTLAAGVLRTPAQAPDNHVTKPSPGERTVLPIDSASRPLTVQTSRSESFEFLVPAHWQVVDERGCVTGRYAVVVASYGWDLLATPANCPTPEQRTQIALELSYHPPTVTMAYLCGSRADTVTIDVPGLGSRTFAIDSRTDRGETWICGGFSAWPDELHLFAKSREGAGPVLDVLRTLEH